METVFQIRRDFKNAKFTGKNLDEHFSKMLALRSRLKELKEDYQMSNFVLRFGISS
jgi:hypothetical protein